MTARLIRFNKPYGVLSQFTPEGKWQGLKDYIDLPGVYVAGRLDADSEGLLLLTNDGRLQAHIADPRFKMEKTYWVQVEGVPDEAALAALRSGVVLNDGPTLPARARRMEPAPEVWPRTPPIHDKDAGAASASVTRPAPGARFERSFSMWLGLRSPAHRPACAADQPRCSRSGEVTASRPRPGMSALSSSWAARASGITAPMATIAASAFGPGVLSQ